MYDDIPYLLLTPGPLSTSKTVKSVMLQDYCTWDDDYNSIVQAMRSCLTRLATSSDAFTTVPVQGSGTFGVEAALGSLIPPNGKLLVMENGAYGARMLEICRYLKISTVPLRCEETEQNSPAALDAALKSDPTITHVAAVHCETTTGILNPIGQIGEVVKSHGKQFIVDAMSTFGGIPLSMESLHANVLISSANKCIQGVPGFSYVICEKERLSSSQGWARSLSLDLHAQWKEMETKHGKWRYTSPTHVVRAFVAAMDELEAEGGVPARNARYQENDRVLNQGMKRLGFRPLLPDELRSPIISSFYYPTDPRFTFESFYEAVKRRRFVIYPGKISKAPTFRIGTIGYVFPADMEQLLVAIQESLQEIGVKMAA